MSTFKIGQSLIFRYKYGREVVYKITDFQFDTNTGAWRAVVRLTNTETSVTELQFVSDILELLQSSVMYPPEHAKLTRELWGYRDKKAAELKDESLTILDTTGT